MAIEWKPAMIRFDATQGIMQRESVTVPFNTRVLRAEAMLKGFNIKYTNGDHHVLEEEIDLDSTFSGNAVTVTASFLLRDSSGNIDDPFRGFVEAVVIAETA